MAVATKSILPFAKYEATAYPIRFQGKIHVATLAGGTPTDQHVAEGWLKTKFAGADALIQEAATQVMAERGIPLDEAIKFVDATKHLNGFKRDGKGLYIEGRQLKAALKEAVSVAVAAGKLEGRGWGKTNKGLLNYVAEHVFVVQDRLPLFEGEYQSVFTQPTGIAQRFVHTFRGAGIQYEEYVENVTLQFIVITDHDFTEEQWAMIWLTGQQQGIGASRSQGFGRYTVTEWRREK